jgi:hypothetical protein
LIFKPNQQVLYPGETEGDYSNPNHSAVFSHKDTIDYPGYYDEIRDINLFGGIGKSISSGKQYLTDGSIVIGNVVNRKGNLPNVALNSYYSNNNIEKDFGPTTKYPIIDEVQPFDAGSFGQTLRNTYGLPSNKSADDSEYETGGSLAGRARCPELIENMFYIYKAYPYIMLPDPMVVGVGEGPYEKFPRYRPSVGDIPNEYSYKIDIDKFSGSSCILCGVSTFNSNWIVGTDNGIFYSLEKGTDVNRSDINGKVFSIIYTSGNVAIASIILNNGDLQLIRSQKNKDLGVEVGQVWTNITGTQELFYKSEIKRIYNFTEYNEKIYASSNMGIICGDVDGTNWKLLGSVGNIESLSGGRILGQNFVIN